MKRTLVIFLLTILLIAVGSAQRLPPQNKSDTRSRTSAESAVAQDFMPNFSTGKFTCADARKTLGQMRQEKVDCRPPEPPPNSNYPAETIFDQDPPAGARLPPNTYIKLRVSNGQPIVPPASPTTDNTNNNNTAPVEPSADVSVKQRLDSTGPFRAGQTVQFTITIDNAGPENATNVVLVERPTNLSVGEGSGDCKTFPCTIPNIAKDAEMTITLTASIDRDGPFESRVEVSATPKDLKTNDNLAVTGAFADPILATPSPTLSPTPSPTFSPSASPTPPPSFPDPVIWLIVVLAVGGGGLVVSGGTAVHIIRKRRRLRLNGSQPSPQPSPPPSQPPPPPPPIPRVDAKVDLRSGKSEIDRLQMAGPQIRLQTDLRSGGTTFDGPIPIVKTEVRNE